MQLLSVKVDARSVAISIPKISTAWLSNPWLLTKRSDTTTAAAPPSLVGQH